MKTRQIIHHRKLVAEYFTADDYSSKKEYFLDLMQKVSSEKVGKPTTFLSIIESAAIRMGETCYVSSDMVALAERAAADMPPEGVVPNLDLVPIDAAVMKLEQPIEFPGLEGTPYLVDTIVWNKKGDFVYLALLSSTELMRQKFDKDQEIEGLSDDDPKIIANEKYLKSNGSPIHIVGAGTLRSDEAIPVSVGKEFHEKWIEAQLWQEEIGGNNPKELERILSQVDSPQFAEESPNPHGIVWSLMVLMNQKITRMMRAEPHRRDLKQLEKYQFQPQITVIEYRRSESILDNEHQQGTGRKLNFRHIVRGHWRTNYRTGKKDIYVSPHFRGPEDAPLYVSEKINAMVR